MSTGWKEGDDPSAIADEFFAAFHDVVFTVTDDETAFMNSMKAFDEAFQKIPSSLRADLFKPVAGALHAINTANAKRQKHIKTLEARIAALEARPAMKDMGTWEDGRWYEPGSVTSFQGSAWVTNTRTNATPGTPDTASRAWRLMVKKGRDGKDLR